MYNRKLDTFIVVAQHGNLTAAAKSLYITQPVVSAQIKGLEKELGAELLTRSKKGVALTPAGEVLLERAQEIKALCRRTEAEVRHAAEEESRSVRFITTENMFSDLSARACELYRKSFPDCRLEFMYQEPGGPGQLIGLVADGRADLAITTEDARFAENGLVFEPLREVPLLCVMAKDHPLAERAAIGARELLPFSVNLYAKGHSNPTDYLWSLFVENGAADRIVARNWVPLQEISSSTTITLFAERLPQFEPCAVVPLDDSVPKLVQGIVYRRGANPATHLLAECLQKVYDSGDGQL